MLIPSDRHFVPKVTSNKIYLSRPDKSGNDSEIQGKSDEILDQSTFSEIQSKESNINANCRLKNSGTIVVLTALEK